MSQQLVLKPWPGHMSYSQVNAIADCGERYRLERGFGLRGRASWSLVGGKAFHSATEFVDIALERVRSPQTVWAQPDRTVVASPTQSQDGPELGTPVDEKQLYIDDLVFIKQAQMGALEDAALEVAATDEDHPGSIREMWHAALAIEIASQQLEILRTDQPGDQRPFTVPDAALWRAAGRASARWPDKENHQWWLETGVSMLENYVRWRQTSGWTIAWLGATPAIELDLTAVLADDIRVVGYMDRGMLNPDLGQAPTIVDIKTNKVEPSSAEQLGLYATLLEVLGFPRAPYGSYYMARAGVMSDPYDLSVYPLEYFQWKYRASKAVRDAGNLQANPQSTFCGICGVRDYCYAVSGAQAHLVPKPWQRPVSV